MNAIIIDDEQQAREMLAAHLRAFCPQVQLKGQAEDGRKGLELFRDTKPDLFFLDVEMPDMNGLEFLRRIRRHKHLFDTPVVLFTAHAAQVDIVRGLQAGADGYIAKPIAASALVAAVRTVLGH